MFTSKWKSGKRVNKKDKIYCIECCHLLPKPIFTDTDEMTVCINKDCDLYGKVMSNWSFDESE